ncbi:hypothetical protein A2V61_01260 [Candidatus Woesebacteria bacterium RBG_19FT_COMBO_47_8]|uniref:Cell division protein FtsL n=1 Tax=Candidatus Woesebacteria bacterium RBG_13_46_13 TaxID=1802479 RepID=A0A1F7X401_9BACT|nr:MAG: hypothetical protein A2Y68_03910 [Candidatus Woesebacteria bacterium RBG_13_46_13]OGM18181.1 MAG: hypothetical protein A2V61_01260 [Candidatus Woesebacteria bacterium RBG_19FT_COMBO_47_8]HJX58945.1 hypothetical protein [Patescibacteria group bacterium]
MKSKKSAKNIIFWVLGISFLAFFVFLTVETATSGATLSYLEKQEQNLSRENSDLEDSIVKASSLNGFEKKSAELGFVKPSQILYINGKEEVAKLP